MATTVRDVAERAGVSPATVSRALHGNRAISEATRAKVLRAAEELGYVLTPAARDRPRVAVVTPYIDRWYFAHVLDGVERTLAERGILVIVHRLLDLDDRRRALLGDVPRLEADGVLLVNVPPAPDEAHFLAGRRVPLVLLGAALDGVPSVEIDDAEAARTATEYLIRLGHRRIGLISGRRFERIPFTTPPERRRGFQLAHSEAHLPWDPDLQVPADFTATGGHRAARALLERVDRPTAILAISDEMALGALAAARDLGIQVPQDLSIVGIDDHDLSGIMGLTTVAQPVRTLGELASLQLAGLIARNPPAGAVPERVMVPTMLVVRASTGPPGGTPPP